MNTKPGGGAEVADAGAAACRELSAALTAAFRELSAALTAACRAFAQAKDRPGDWTPVALAWNFKEAVDAACMSFDGAYSDAYRIFRVALNAL